MDGRRDLVWPGFDPAHHACAEISSGHRSAIERHNGFIGDLIFDVLISTLPEAHRNADGIHRYDFQFRTLRVFGAFFSRNGQDEGDEEDG